MRRPVFSSTTRMYLALCCSCISTVLYSQNINVEAKFPQAFEKMAVNIPNELTGSEVNVHNMGDESHCASLAFARFKHVVNMAAANRAFGKAWDQTISMAKLLPLGGLISNGIDIADLIEKAYTSPDAESFTNEVKKANKGKLIDYGIDKGS